MTELWDRIAEPERTSQTKKSNFAAKENHEKFLYLWKDADSDIAEVSSLIEDARKRLSGLKGQ
jgi:hypothetical protein